MADNIFYVYKYLGPDGVPYYIGKGKGNRIHKQHTHVAIPPEDRRVFVKTDLLEADALALEMKLIREYGRKVDGGILDNTKLNQWACTSGWNHSEETKQKISLSNSGKVRTKEQRDNYKKPKSAQHVEKIRQANVGRTKSAETKQKISDSKQGTVPWNKGNTGGTWSEARRNAFLQRKHKDTK